MIGVPGRHPDCRSSAWIHWTSTDELNRTTTLGSDSARNRLTAATGGVDTGYGYDARNELTSISGPVTASFTYNGAGERVSKTANGTTTTDYTWDQTGIGQVLSDGNQYVWGLGLISQIASGTPTYAQSDGLGSTRLLTDGTGTVVGTQDYDAFGATRDQTGMQLPFTYTGEQVDPESGLVYLRNRYLEPATGRFLTPDPLGFLGSGVNLYAYVGSSPTNGVDPSGLYWGQKWMHRGFQSTGFAEAVVVADAVAVALDSTAVAITDTTTVIGCVAGVEGCGAGYLTGAFLAQPLNNVSAEYFGTGGVVLGCLNNGLRAKDWLSSAEKQAIGILIPEPHLDLAWDISILSGDSQSLHSLEGRDNSSPATAPRTAQPSTGTTPTGTSLHTSNGESPAGCT